MSQDMPPRYGREMSCRRAARLARDLREAAPQLTCEVWAIAQGLAYIRVEGPTTRGIVQVVLHTEREVTHFRQLLESETEPRPGSARWNDKHRPFGPDTTMA